MSWSFVLPWKAWGFLCWGKDEERRQAREWVGHEALIWEAGLENWVEERLLDTKKRPEGQLGHEESWHHGEIHCPQNSPRMEQKWVSVTSGGVPVPEWVVSAAVWVLAGVRLTKADTRRGSNSSHLERLFYKTGQEVNKHLRREHFLKLHRWPNCCLISLAFT